MLDTALSLYESPTGPKASEFDPKYKYLRVVVDGRVAYLIRGSIEQRAEGSVEVWYSSNATREIVRLLNGRIYSTSGLSTDWRETRLQQVPLWASSGPFVRERDVMPGYRFGIRDEIVRTAIEPPKSSALVGVPASSLEWYEERSVSTPSTASLPHARFAVTTADGATQVVYSEQCLSRELCMSFERWTPPSPAPGTPARAGT